MSEACAANSEGDTCGANSRYGDDMPRRAGPGRVVLGSYLVFVVAATSRSAVQLATHASRAPLAYGLSTLAAAIYIAGFVLVRRADRGGGTQAVLICAGVELLGVLAVGTASVVDPNAFADATVWSYYGAGYLFVPLALPVLAIVWVRGRRPNRPPADGPPARRSARTTPARVRRPTA